MPERPTTKVTTVWEEGFRFRNEDAFGHTLVLDAPTGAGASFQGFKPAHALLAALASCTGIDVVSILKKQRQQLTGLEINVTGYQRPEPPTPYEEINVEYVLHGVGLDEDAVRRAIKLSEEKYCTVEATIRGVAKVTSSYRILEEGKSSKAA